MTPVTIVPTGTANLASVSAALRRSGAEPDVAAGANDILKARALVLPGVGSYGATMERIRANGWENPLRTRIQNGIPILAICLGMQILFDSSEESPGVPGLGILPGHFERFPTSIQAPHVGWNTVVPLGETRFLTSGDAYFTHSYRLKSVLKTICGASTKYDTAFISAVEYWNILACQFHPELSGRWGITLLQRWLKEVTKPC